MWNGHKLENAKVADVEMAPGRAEREPAGCVGEIVLKIEDAFAVAVVLDDSVAGDELDELGGVGF